MTDPRPAELLAAAREALPAIIELRRRVHRRPEIGLDLPETQALIVEELRRLELEPVTGRGLGSIVAVVQPDGGAEDGAPVTLLRADMDALPLAEASGLEFASEAAGAMHACGHDLHVAMLLGAARLLAERRKALPGPAILMFQPGEEGFAGARRMLEEGLLNGRDPAAVRAFALHVFASLPSGEVHVRAGTQLASADSFKVTIHGRGGHASKPHLALDPIVVAAEIVTALQVAVSREVDIFDPVVLTIAQLHAGTTHNIIPQSAFMEGTFRTLSAHRRDRMIELVPRVASAIAGAHGLTADFALEELYPVTVNDAEVVETVVDLATELLGAEAVVPMDAPAMAAEDFSFVLERVKGAMAFLGARPPEADPATAPDNHSDRVVFDEPALAIGAALHAAFALRGGR